VLSDRVVEVLTEHDPGLLLDIPAGCSPVGERAGSLGYEVVELDLFPPRGFRGVRADACRALPFADAAFDVVLSMEGIEHFENQAGFVRECARVLKPGGTLIVTTPNVLHLSARVSGLLTGQRALKRGFINADQTLRGRENGRTYHGHAFLIDVFRLRYLMEVEGVELEGLRRGRLSTGSLLFGMLMPAVWIATSFALWSGRRVRRRAGGRVVRGEVERKLKRLANDPALLFSRKLIAVATKPAL